MSKLFIFIGSLTHTKIHTNLTQPTTTTSRVGVETLDRSHGQWKPIANPIGL